MAISFSTNPTYIDPLGKRDLADQFRKVADDKIAAAAREAEARIARAEADLALTKELAAAQVQALVLRVADLTAQLQAARGE